MTSTPSWSVLKIFSKRAALLREALHQVRQVDGSSVSSRPSTRSSEVCFLPGISGCVVPAGAARVNGPGRKSIWSGSARSARSLRRNISRWMRAAAQPDDGVPVLVRAVALVLREPVARVPRVQLRHHPVAGDLRDDRGHGDAERAGVAPDDRQVRDRGSRAAAGRRRARGTRPSGTKASLSSSEEKRSGSSRRRKAAGGVDALQRAAHRELGRAQDVVQLDLLDARRAVVRVDLALGGERLELAPERLALGGRTAASSRSRGPPWSPPSGPRGTRG